MATPITAPRRSLGPSIAGGLAVLAAFALLVVGDLRFGRVCMLAAALGLVFLVAPTDWKAAVARVGTFLVALAWLDLAYDHGFGLNLSSTAYLVVLLGAGIGLYVVQTQRALAPRPIALVVLLIALGGIFADKGFAYSNERGLAHERQAHEQREKAETLANLDALLQRCAVALDASRIGEAREVLGRLEAVKGDDQRVRALRTRLTAKEEYLGKLQADQQRREEAQAERQRRAGDRGDQSETCDEAMAAGRDYLQQEVEAGCAINTPTGVQSINRDRQDCQLMRVQAMQYTLAIQRACHF